MVLSSGIAEGTVTSSDDPSAIPESPQSQTVNEEPHKLTENPTLDRDDNVEHLSGT